jgi:hypothetical protein
VSVQRGNSQMKHQQGHRPSELIIGRITETAGGVGLNGQRLGAPATTIALQENALHQSLAADSSSRDRVGSSGGGVDRYWQCTAVEAMPALLQQRLLELAKPEQEGVGSRGDGCKGGKKHSKARKAAGSGVAAV